MTRSVPEWIGKTDDAKIPMVVKLRVFARFGGLCHISGILIRPGDLWDCEHVVALCNGGKHRESNLAPALRDKHRKKTAADVAEKSRVNRKRAFHLGLKPAKRPIQSRGFSKAPGQKRASSPIDKPLWRLWKDCE